MRELIKMVVVLTIISTVSGYALGFVYKFTEMPRKQAEFQFAKEPALRKVLPEYANDLVADQFEVNDPDGKPVVIYPAKDASGKLLAVGYEAKGSGFGGDVRIMVGVDVDTKALRGIGVVAHAETPGLGARITLDSFQEQFKKGYSVDSSMAVKADGGSVDALTGSTISSRAVCDALNAAFKFYKAAESDIKK